MKAIFFINIILFINLVFAQDQKLNYVGLNSSGDSGKKPRVNSHDMMASYNNFYNGYYKYKCCDLKLYNFNYNRSYSHRWLYPFLLMYDDVKLNKSILWVSSRAENGIPTPNFKIFPFTSILTPWRYQLLNNLILDVDFRINFLNIEQPFERLQFKFLYDF